MDKKKAESYLAVLREELQTALGCTEPIAVAFAAAKAAQVLGQRPTSCHVRCSGNIVKNVKGVTVPNSGGMKGIAVAAVLGAIGGNPELQLDVLRDVTPSHIAEMKRLIKEGFCLCKLAEGVENLYICVILTANKHSSLVEISGTHTNITRIEKDGVVLHESQAQETADGADKSLLCLRGILQFADEVPLKEVKTLLEKQLRYNHAISQEGLTRAYGVEVGRTLLEAHGGATQPGPKLMAKALSAAGSDARMGGCPLPVVINAGSGNQGIAVSMPVKVYAEAYHVPYERMLRALVVANLISLHQKRYIGNLSAYCGAVSAACGAAAGITWMLGEADPEGSYRAVAATITNTIATIGGMVCDGAKPSCAAKISAAIDAALTAFEMSRARRVFSSGEGLVKSNVEETIRSIGRMGREGMRQTDNEILYIMLEN
jgi:L-cysteine desulfidase